LTQVGVRVRVSDPRSILKIFGIGIVGKDVYLFRDYGQNQAIIKFELSTVVWRDEGMVDEKWALEIGVWKGD
jgi:hypothetical protein